MGRFRNSVQPAAPGTTNDVLTFTGAASRVACIKDIYTHGLGTQSLANELGVYRVSVLGITPTNQTSQKCHPDAGAANATVATAWVTQPSLSSVALVRLGVNSNGAIYRWVPEPGGELWVRDNATTSCSQLSLRFTTGGTGPVGVGLSFEDF